jgi:N-methylhydantoinase A
MLEIGIDIGGTFTDFALVDHARRTIGTAKTLTTPQDPAIGVLRGLRELLDRRGLALSDLGRVAHGTTLITNAVLERRGARVGLLTNAGFGDILFIGKEQRYDIADLRLRFPAPLVERRDVVEVAGRLDRHGRERTALDLEAVAAAARRFQADGVEAVAVCFINAYVDGRQEAAAREALRAAGLDLPLCLSSEIAPRAKEYERFTTTVINAYALPATDRYLTRLDAALRELGFAGRVDVMAANGGCLPIAIARQFPVRLIESGPAAGAIMAASLARDLGAATALAFDMGGTTAKGTLIRRGQLAKEDEFEVAHVHKFKPGSGLPLLIPVVDMIEIGSGGGSIAALDDRGVLVVGPRSAGAEPGPACYARGGELPTLTDANVALGYLPVETFASSRMRLEPARAERALLRAFGGLERDESLSLAEIALAIHDKASEDVAKAFRVHCARRGADLEEGLMVAFGGSGPLQACSVAEKIGIGQICFPNGAGVFSAIGLVFAPRSYEYSRTLLLEVDPGRPEAIEEAWRAIHAACCRLFGFDAGDAGVGQPSTTLAMRYRGQGYELPIRLADDAGLSPDAVRGAFEAQYLALNGFTFADTPVEIVHWRIEIAQSEARSFAAYGFEREAVSVPAAGPLALAGDRVVQAPRLRRTDLMAGGEAAGPLLIVDDDTTIFIPPAFTARADRLGNVFATRAV